ncbi:MAG: PQQ-binding-like beta-propeller repeat protein [Alphaproteobacteria bacterium]|jgi:outer membrane protein assembly factor BamB
MTAFITILNATAGGKAACGVPRKLVTMLACFGVFGMAGCSEPELVLPGERIAVTQQVEHLSANQQAMAEGAGLSAPLTTLTASHPGLNAGHAGGHLALDLPLDERWDVEIGTGGDEFVELAVPVVGAGHVFAVSASGEVSAIEIETGNLSWRVSIEDFEDDVIPGIAGGLAISGSTVFVHGGGHNLAALSVEDGSVIWSQRFQLPLRGGPTVYAKKALAVTDIDANLFMLRIDNGSVLWDRAGLPSGTIVYGAPSPAIYDNQIAVAAHGGELSLLDADNGDVIWSDNLATFNPRTPLQGLGDIRAHPVHDGGLVFAVSQSGRTAAFAVRSGLLLWELPIGGIEMPWVAGDSVFIVTLDGRLYAIRRNDGAIRWVAELPGALPIGAVAAEDIPRYVGPVVAAGKVIIVAEDGNILLFNADTGALEDEADVGGRIVTAPQLAAGMMFVLDNSGTLTAFD